MMAECCVTSPEDTPSGNAAVGATAGSKVGPLLVPAPAEVSVTSPEIGHWETPISAQPSHRRLGFAVPADPAAPELRQFRRPDSNDHPPKTLRNPWDRSPGRRGA